MNRSIRRGKDRRADLRLLCLRNGLWTCGRRRPAIWSMLSEQRLAKTSGEFAENLRLLRLTFAGRRGSDIRAISFAMRLLAIDDVRVYLSALGRRGSARPARIDGCGRACDARHGFGNGFGRIRRLPVADADVSRYGRASCGVRRWGVQRRCARPRRDDPAPVRGRRRASAALTVWMEFGFGKRPSFESD